MVLEIKPRLGDIFSKNRVDTINILTYKMLRRFFESFGVFYGCGFFNLNNNGIGI